MKPQLNHLLYNTKALISLAAIACIMLASSCKKNEGYFLASAKVTSVIQINVDETAYSIKSAPDIISFATTAINVSKPNYRQYLVSGTNAGSTTAFSLAFHIDSLGSGNYVMEGSQLIAGGKTYISLASKAADKVKVTKIDNTNKLYSANFSFYSFNQASPKDSVLVTGTYSIQ